MSRAIREREEELRLVHAALKQYEADIDRLRALLGEARACVAFVGSNCAPAPWPIAARDLLARIDAELKEKP